MSEKAVAQTGAGHVWTCVGKRREAHAEGRRNAGVRVGSSLGGANSAELSTRCDDRKKKERRNEPDGYCGEYLLMGKLGRRVWGGRA